MKKNLFPKEKGQGLVEYAFILLLVSIVVIAAMMILGPIIGGVVPDKYQQNAELLSGVDMQYGPESGHPSPLSGDSIGLNNVATKIAKSSCVHIDLPKDKTIKVGTLYQYPEDIDVSLVPVGDKVAASICNSDPGADVYVYVALVTLPH